MKVQTACFRLSFITLIFICVVGWALAEEMMVDTVVAVVNGTSITLSEVRELATDMMKTYNPPPDITSSDIEHIRAIYFRSAILDKIKQKLILDEALKAGIVVLDRQVEQAIERAVIKAEYENLDEMLQDIGMDKSAYFKKKKEEMLYWSVIEAKLLPQINISPRDITDYYNHNIGDYQKPEQAHLYGITFFKKADPLEDEKVLETAKQALNNLREGADFSEIAKQFSEDIEHGKKGGDWGWVDHEGNIAAAAAFDLPVNNISDIMETVNSYWILKVTDKKQAHTASLRQVWGEIKKKLREIEFDRLRQEWLEQLIKEADIVYLLNVGEQYPE